VGAGGAPFAAQIRGLAREPESRLFSRLLVKQAVPAHCTSRYRVRVRFGETDLMGIVHHGTYISYFEVGRVEYMRRRGLDYHSWTELGIHLPVVEAYVRYRRTARFDELLCIETRLSELSRVKVRFDYRLLRAVDGEIAANGTDGTEELVAEGHTLLACVDQHHIPRRIPPEAEAVLLGPELDIPARIGVDGRPRPTPLAPSHAEGANGALPSPSERVAGSKS
jgi:acyl-CoA thioester hydrolase